jgi:hypothetical protein
MFCSGQDQEIFPLRRIIQTVWGAHRACYAMPNVGHVSGAKESKSEITYLHVVPKLSAWKCLK